MRAIADPNFSERHSRLAKIVVNADNEAPLMAGTEKSEIAP